MKALSASVVLAVALLHPLIASATQQVFLDFDSATGGVDRVYTDIEREQILDLVEADYSRFDLVFSRDPFASGPFSTVLFNSGPALGLADDIDFRNLNKSDNATINVGGSVTTSQEFVTLSANIASHELGHILGLRHTDSYGPIGVGIDPASAGATAFTPDYPGPQLASGTPLHLMESDRTNIPEITSDQFFSERSAIKLAFNEQGLVIDEVAGAKSDLASAQAVGMGSMIVPNTLLAGSRAGLGDFDVDAVTVTGSLDVLGEADLYRFDGLAGDLFNFQVISNVVDRITDPIDPQITLLDSSGSPVDYYGVLAFNDDEFESRDAILIDVVLPDDGAYYVRVDAFDNASTGDYELFFHRFNGAIPEPSTFAFASLTALTLLSARRRRQ